MISRLEQGGLYQIQKLQHAFASCFNFSKNFPFSAFHKKLFKELLQQAVETREWMVKGMNQKAGISKSVQGDGI